MEKPSHVQKLTRKWLVVGLVLSLAIGGVGGCGGTSTAEATKTQSTTSNQADQSQTAQKPTLNLAIEAAIGIRRLQSNQQTVLTTDQKDKIKPILQTLIDTSSPSQEFLQQKADAINAVFTDAQKTYLSVNDQKGRPEGNGQNGQEPPKDQTKQKQGAPKGDQAAPSGQLENIYKQVLASLT